MSAPTTRCGLEAGGAYALGLADGRCPVGIVKALDADGVTLELFNWLIGMFDSPDRWIAFSAIRESLRAEVEDLTPGERASDGFYYNEAIKSLFLMDPLGDFQTAWEERNRAEAAS